MTGYDELLAARVRQLKEIDDWLERATIECRQLIASPGDRSALACGLLLGKVEQARRDLANMIRVAEAEHAAF